MITKRQAATDRSNPGSLPKVARVLIGRAEGSEGGGGAAQVEADGAENAGGSSSACSKSECLLEGACAKSECLLESVGRRGAKGGSGHGSFQSTTSTDPGSTRGSATSSRKEGSRKASAEPGDRCGVQAHAIKEVVIATWEAP